MNKQQLANRIWASANKMRSKIDANEYKDYILGLIFYKFLCDNEEQYLRKDGWNDEDMPYLVEDYEDANAKDTIEYCQKNIGYFIEYKYLFSTWLKPETSFTVADLSAALSNFDRLVSPNYKRVYEKIFLTLQAGLSKLGENPTSQTRALKDLIKLIKDIPTDGGQDYDVLGYVYEYLIGNFAANAGKKAGEFYTPHEVAILMSEIVAEHHKKKETIEIYDPTSGSGSLLITIGKSVGRHIEDKNKVKYYAQELKENTYNLTRMNLVMRGIKPDNINTRCADSLDEDWPVQTADMSKPLYVDAVVSNPPYSQHWNPADADLDARFKEYGVAPKSKADYAFLLHELHHIKPDGILTIVLPHGVLFRGDPEKDADGEGKIRKNLIEKNNIDAIIGLPANIFFGTGIPTLIMVLKQRRDNDDILIIDASKGFVKDGKQNKLRACDIKRIADTIRDRATIPGFSRAVSRNEVRQNGYNLNIPRYVDSSEAAVQYDIYATMFGGIPESEIDSLAEYWEALPSLREELFGGNADGSPYASVKVENISEAINANKDVEALRQTFTKSFEGFEDMLHDKLITNVLSVKEMKEQDAIADDIFNRVQSVPLVDKYAAYQSLSDNWQIIVNDIETIQSEGIDAVRVVEQAYKMVKKNDEEIEVPDGLKGRIIPFSLVQQVKYQAELRKIESLQDDVETCLSTIDEIRDTFTDEEGATYLNEDDNTKLNMKAIKAAIKANNDDIEPETKDKLKAIAAQDEKKSKLNKEIKAAKADLEEKTINTIQCLKEDEVNEYLHLKWITPIYRSVSEVLPTKLSYLYKTIQALVNKYASPYNNIGTAIDFAEKEIATLIGELEGDKFTLKGLNQYSKDPKALSMLLATSLFPQDGEHLPKARFKGCSGTWERKHLYECLEISNEKNTNNEYGINDVLSVSDDYGVINQIELLGRSYAGKSVSNYGILREGQIVYTKSPLKSKPYGIVKHNSYKTGIVSVLYAIYNVKENVSAEYIHCYFDPYWRLNKYLRPLVRKGAKNTMNISDEEALSGYILIPSSVEEQVKIAKFFKLLDELISLEGQRVESLKRIKSACLDKMFV